MRAIEFAPSPPLCLFTMINFTSKLRLFRALFGFTSVTVDEAGCLEAMTVTLNENTAKAQCKTKRQHRGGVGCLRARVKTKVRVCFVGWPRGVGGAAFAQASLMIG